MTSPISKSAAFRFRRTAELGWRASLNRWIVKISDVLANCIKCISSRRGLSLFPGIAVRYEFPASFQIAVESKKLLSPDVDHDKAVILCRAGDLDDLSRLDGCCGMMVVPEGKDHNREVETKARFRLPQLGRGR